MTGIFTIVAYLGACFVAWGCHELAHYAVHSIHAETVTLGVNRLGPYTDATYTRGAPIYAIRLGSVAPTLLYSPLVAAGIWLYLRFFSLPQLSLVEWSFVLTPLAILVVPTVADLREFVYASQ